MLVNSPIAVASQARHFDNVVQLCDHYSCTPGVARRVTQIVEARNALRLYADRKAGPLETTRRLHEILCNDDS